VRPPLADFAPILPVMLSEAKHLVSGNQAAYHVRNETLRYRSG